MMIHGATVKVVESTEGEDYDYVLKGTGFRIGYLAKHEKYYTLWYWSGEGYTPAICDGDKQTFPLTVAKIEETIKDAGKHLGSYREVYRAIKNENYEGRRV